MSQLYIVYLDEFGHVGPYISKDHPKHNTHPIFGLGGFVLPASKVRSFSTFFFELKKHLFDRHDIPKARKKARLAGEEFKLSTWERKGSKQYSVGNMQNHKRELTGSTNRIINRITKDGGFLFYVGQAKHLGVDKHNPEATYIDSLKEMIKRLDDEFKSQDAQFLILMDDHPTSTLIVKKALYQMHQNGRYQLIEAPLQVDSKLYQTIQCADWLCAIYGKLQYYKAEPNAVPKYEVFEKYFGDRVGRAKNRSNVRDNIERMASPNRLDELATKFNG
jgi:hypothetical protein